MVAIIGYGSRIMLWYAVLVGYGILADCAEFWHSWLEYCGWLEQYAMVWFMPSVYYDDRWEYGVAEKSRVMLWVWLA
jgi:hypothetical protein